MEILVETIYEDQSNSLYIGAHKKFEYIKVHKQIFFLIHFNIFRLTKRNGIASDFHMLLKLISFH